MNKQYVSIDEFCQAYSLSKRTFYDRINRASVKESDGSVTAEVEGFQCKKILGRWKVEVFSDLRSCAASRLPASLQGNKKVAIVPNCENQTKARHEEKS